MKKITLWVEVECGSTFQEETSEQMLIATGKALVQHLQTVHKKNKAKWAVESQHLKSKK